MSITTRAGKPSSFRDVPPSSSSPLHSRHSTFSNSLCYTLPPSNSVFSLCSCLRLALPHSSHPCVLWPPTAPSILFLLPCPMHQYSSVHFSYPTPNIDLHTSIIIHTHPQSLLSCTYFPHSVLLPSSRIVRESDVLHRLISVSTFVGFPGWTFHRSLQGLSPCLCYFEPPILIYLCFCSLLRPCSALFFLFFFFSTFCLVRSLYNVYLFLDV